MHFRIGLHGPIRGNLLAADGSHPRRGPRQSDWLPPAATSEASRPSALRRLGELHASCNWLVCTQGVVRRATMDGLHYGRRLYHTVSEESSGSYTLAVRQDLFTSRPVRIVVMIQDFPELISKAFLQGRPRQTPNY